jgi:Zn-dependent peptidase ImmA (M78 family)/transcriptional regulator with XRE-family HTH domain
MNNIFSQRLKSARLMSGLSMDELCSKMQNKVSKTAISRYEKGEMMPDSSVVISLSNALNVKVDYFFRPFTVSLRNIEFRKRASLNSGKRLLSIKEHIFDKIERYVEIENILCIDSGFSTDFSAKTVKSRSDIYVLAEGLRKEWDLGIGSINNVVELLENHGIKVVEIESGRKFDGLSGFLDKIPVIVLNKKSDSERKRFTALHELGHLLLNFESSVSDKEQESLCNLFASEVLLPKDVFIVLIGHNRHNISLKELKDIQKIFGISVEAMMYKAKELNVITENRFVYFNKQMNFSESLKQAIRESIFPQENSNRFERLVYRALASEIITDSKASVLLGANVETVRTGLNLV